MNCFNALNMRANAENYHNEAKSGNMKERIEDRVLGASLSGMKEIGFLWDNDSDLADYIDSHRDFYEGLGFTVYSGCDCGFNEIIIGWGD